MEVGSAAIVGRWCRELPGARAEVGTATQTLRVTRRDADRGGAETVKPLRRLNPQGLRELPGARDTRPAGASCRMGGRAGAGQGAFGEHAVGVGAAWAAHEGLDESID